MARLWSSGFELNSLTAGVEITSVTGSPTIVTSPVRSGTYALSSDVSSSQAWARYTFASPGIEVVYYRFYLRIATSVSETVNIFDVNSPTEGLSVHIGLTSSNTLQLINDAGVPSGQVGSDSSALSLNQWYRVELAVDSSTIIAVTLEARLDGTPFASGEVEWDAGDQGYIDFGIVGIITSGTILFDDLAINDSSGSFQNSWPGEGEIIHLRPNLEGDNDDWDGLNGYQEVYEVTPDDATTFYNTTRLNELQDEQIDYTPVALASDDTINCVHVGARFNLNATASGYSFVTRFKKATGETVSESGNITPTTTTWMTNAIGASRNYPLTLYQN